MNPPLKNHFDRVMLPAAQDSQACACLSKKIPNGKGAAAFGDAANHKELGIWVDAHDADEIMRGSLGMNAKCPADKIGGL
jgi:hypothetical protein